MWLFVILAFLLALNYFLMMAQTATLLEHVDEPGHEHLKRCWSNAFEAFVTPGGVIFFMPSGKSSTDNYRESAITDNVMLSYSDLDSVSQTTSSPTDSSNSSSMSSSSSLTSDIDGLNMQLQINMHMFPAEAGFALTAFNPADPNHPQNLSVEENLARNSLLRLDIEELLVNYFSSVSIQVYPSYGFGSGGWREDGFLVGCSESIKSQVQEQVLRLARKYGQGAIFSYHKKSSVALLRETLPASDAFLDTYSIVDVVRVTPPEDWTGKSDWPRYIWHPTQFYKNQLHRE